MNDPSKSSPDNSSKAAPDSESARRTLLYGSKPKGSDPDGVRTVEKAQTSNAPLWGALGLVVVGVGIAMSGAFERGQPVDSASVSRPPANGAEPDSVALPNDSTKPHLKVPRATPIAKPSVGAAHLPQRENAVNPSTNTEASFIPASMPDDSGTAPESEEQPQDGSKPTIRAGAYIEALRASGETKGIAAFNPPGTNPPKSGIIVPDDYELPPGYVRHYQTTDDGEQLSPVLTLAPGYELLDEDGQAIELPPGRVLPPELVPLDLPQEVLEIPEPKVRH